MNPPVHPVDEHLPLGRLTALGLQHVLVMYAGAVAVPLIVGRALNLTPDQVAKLISADLFVCGLVTLIQALGASRWFGIQLPVMMGVTFASVAPMISMAQSTGGTAGAGLIFGSVIGAGVISILIAPLVSRMLRFFLQKRVSVRLGDLVIIGVDFAEGEEAVTISAIIDEGRLQRRLDPGDLG